MSQHRAPRRFDEHWWLSRASAPDWLRFAYYGSACAGPRARADTAWLTLCDYPAAPPAEVRLTKCTSSRVQYPAADGGSWVILS
jgi:hypothetical protein